MGQELVVDVHLALQKAFALNLPMFGIYGCFSLL